MPRSRAIAAHRLQIDDVHRRIGGRLEEEDLGLGRGSHRRTPAGRARRPRWWRCRTWAAGCRSASGRIRTRPGRRRGDRRSAAGTAAPRSSPPSRSRSRGTPPHPQAGRCAVPASPPSGSAAANTSCRAARRQSAPPRRPRNHRRSRRSGRSPPTSRRTRTERSRRGRHGSPGRHVSVIERSWPVLRFMGCALPRRPLPFKPTSPFQANPSLSRERTAMRVASVPRRPLPHRPAARPCGGAAVRVPRHRAAPARL